MMQQLKHSWQCLIVPELGEAATACGEASLRQSQIVLSCLMRGLQTHGANAIVAVWRGAGLSQAGDELSSLPFTVAGRAQSWSVQGCFPLKACHSPHVIDNTEKRGKTVHLGSIYLHYSAPPSLPFPSHAHIHTQTNTAMTACRWTTWAHRHTNTQNTFQPEHTHAHGKINNT